MLLFFVKLVCEELIYLPFVDGHMFWVVMKQQKPLSLFCVHLLYHFFTIITLLRYDVCVVQYYTVFQRSGDYVLAGL